MKNRDPLLLELYGCPTQPAHWSQVLDRLCSETGAASAVVQTLRFERDAGPVLWQASDHRTAGRPALSMSTVANPRMARHRGLRGLDRVVTDDDLFDQDDPERVTLEQQLTAAGIGQFMGQLQRLDDDTYLAVALHRASGDRRDFGRATRLRLQSLAPHLRQAVSLASELRRQVRARSQLEAHLGGLRCGLLICNGQARVQWMNHRARRLTDGTRELMVHGGLLRARQPTATRALHDEIAGVGRAPRFLAVGDGPRALHVALRAHGDLRDKGSVLLALTHATDITQVPVEAWSRLLGVTPAEAALVATLVTGGTLEQHALHRGVSAGTVRGQLKQVLAKTSTHRQADLVRLALSSAATHLMDSVAEA